MEKRAVVVLAAPCVAVPEGHVFVAFPADRVALPTPGVSESTIEKQNMDAWSMDVHDRCIKGDCIPPFTTSWGGVLCLK